VWFLPYLQLLLLLHLLLLLTLLESGFRSKFSRTSWKLHGFCVFFGKCRIFMISFHFVVRTLHKLHLLGLAEQPPKKKKVRLLLLLLLPAVPSSSDFYFIAFAVCTSTSCVWFRLFVLSFVAFLVQGGATQLESASMCFCSAEKNPGRTR
jgi:hypothetical protein